MLKGQNIEIKHFCGDMSESIDFLDEDIEQHSPTYKVNIVGLKSLHRCSSRDFSENDYAESINLDDDLAHSSTHHQEKLYKCYKCYGQNKNLNNGETRMKCRECSGTEFIPQSHPLVSIMQELLRKKIPTLIAKIDESKKPDKKRENLQLEYGCKDPIKEQSFSYQQQSIQTCRSCNKECDSNNDRSCQSCSDYFVCENCYEKKRFTHSHSLVLKEKSKVRSKLSFQPHIMKKISEKIQFMESSNYLEGLQLHCHNCNKLIEDVYQSCLNCQKEGIQFVICGPCSENRSYSHDAHHELAMKTMAQAGLLMRLSSRQSANHSQDLQSLQGLQLSNNGVDLSQSIQVNNSIRLQREDTQHSIVNINHHDLESSYDSSCMPEDNIYLRNNTNRSNNQSIVDSFNFNNDEPHEDFFVSSLRHKLSKTYHNDGELEKISQKVTRNKDKKQIDSSVINIDMSCSMDYQMQNHETKDHKQEQKEDEESYSPTLPFVPIFSATNNQMIRPTRVNPQEQYIFNDYECDICHVTPIKNKRYHCTLCENYDLCESCYLIRSKKHQHQSFQEIDGLLMLKQQRQTLIKTNQMKISQKMPRLKPLKELRGTCK